MLLIARLKETAVGFLFPQWGLGCSREGTHICPSCRQRLSHLTVSPYPTYDQSQSGGQLYLACTHYRQRIDGIRVPFRFNGLIRQAIHHLKSRNMKALALAQPLAGQWANVADAFVYPDAALGGLTVLLVDDVTTSWTTMNTCAGAPKTAQTGFVWALVPAR
jgi:predicted amidophosphoribosyltransferase